MSKGLNFKIYDDNGKMIVATRYFCDAQIILGSMSSELIVKWHNRVLWNTKKQGRCTHEGMAIAFNALRDKLWPQQPAKGTEQ